MLCQVRFGEYWRSQGAHPSTTSFQHGVVLYCQAEPRSRDIILFYRNSTIIFVPGIEMLYYLPSHKIIIQKYPVLLETLQPVMRSSWETWNPAGLPPTHFYLSDVEGAIYTECRGTIPQYTVLLTLCLVTHWFSLRRHHLNHHYHLPSSLYLEKVSWFYLGCHYASFLTRYLGFPDLFSNPP
jgi:hypothetical protein